MKTVTATFTFVFAWAFMGMAYSQPRTVFPGATWERRSPEGVGLDAGKLDSLRDFVGGRGCVVRHGYMVYTWGDPAARTMVLSSGKPWISHFLFKAVEEGRIPSLDQKVSVWEPRLNSINAALGYKDRDITWRHMANQISGYGNKDKPGAAFNYNDYQMALLFDTLMYKVYGATVGNVDQTVLHPKLTGPLQCEDAPCFMGNDLQNAGLIRVSPRDFARFVLLYLREGNWKGTQLLSRKHSRMAVTSGALLKSVPDSEEQLAEMIPGQRTLGRVARPQRQTGAPGSLYSWLWWTNGVKPDGERHWPDAPTDTYGAMAGSHNVAMAIPSLDLVVVWYIEWRKEASWDPDMNQALRLLVQSVTDPLPNNAKRKMDGTHFRPVA